MCFILTICGCVLFSSCSSTKKLKTSETFHADIASTQKRDSVIKTRLDSSAKINKEKTGVSSEEITQTKTTIDSSSETITLNLSPEFISIDSINGEYLKHEYTTGKPANDYAAADGTQVGYMKPKVFDVNINGNKIHSSRPITSIVIQNKRGSSIVDASTFKVKDSTRQTDKSTVKLNKGDSAHFTGSRDDHAVIDSRVSARSVKRFGMNSWFVIIMSLSLVGGIFAWRMGWLDWFIVLFKRKRTDKTQT